MKRSIEKNLAKLIVVLCLSGFFSCLASGQDPQVTRIGMVGLDTSHAPAFTKLFNREPAAEGLEGFRVVAAYPFGSRTIESSASRIPKYTEDVKALGVEIVDSVESLLAKVDVVLLETNDGKPHLEQALKVFKAGKPVFIDKPVAHNLAHAMAIYRLAERYDVPIFSSSSLRFGATVQAVRRGQSGKVMGCDAFSPCAIEPSHTELFWYGIHGCEILYACMGVGCKTVRCSSSTEQDVVVGEWGDGRIGTFRGMRTGKRGYGGHAFCEKAVKSVGPYEGYEPLLLEIAQFFRTGKAPVTAEETIELYTFMEAAQKSKRKGGEPVKLAEVRLEFQKRATEILNRSAQSE